MDGLSPLTQRIVALGLLVLLLLSGLRLAVAVAGWTTASLEALDDSRFQLAKLQAIRARAAPIPGSPIPAGAAFSAKAHGQALASAVGAIRSAAGATGVQVQAAPEPLLKDNPNLLSIRVAASGREAALLGFVAQVERSQPAIRLRSWTLARTAPQSPELSLKAVAVAAWSGR
jgi:hypothetical protein